MQRLILFSNLFLFADAGCKDWTQVVIAYEPVWAIGTGKSASSELANSIISMIRSTVRELYGDAVADALRIQYGGSVKPANAVEIFSQKDVDGGLIGGASLDADMFLDIIKAI